MNKIKNNKLVIISSIVFFVIGIVGLIVYNNKNNKEVNNIDVSEFLVDDENANKNTNDSTNDITNDSTNVNSSEYNANSNEVVNNIYIHIIGEVKYQGIVVLQEGQRVVDAIEKAGGVTDNADLSKVNLAYILSDGQKVCIPNINNIEEDFVFVYEGGESVTSSGTVGDSVKNKVNINTASQTELETLTGIGPSIAAKIIQYRKENAKFDSIEELKNVSGIGDSKFEIIKDEVIVK